MSVSRGQAVGREGFKILFWSVQTSGNTYLRMRQFLLCISAILPVDQNDQWKLAQILIFRPSSVFGLPAPNLWKIRLLAGKRVSKIFIFLQSNRFHESIMNQRKLQEVLSQDQSGVQKEKKYVKMDFGGYPRKFVQAY